MGWRERYASRIVSAEEAVARLQPGRRILIGSGAAEPATLVGSMVAGSARLADNEVVHLLTLGPAPYVKPGLEHRFRHTAFFIGANVREAVREGRADFMPVFLSEIPELIRSRRVRIDVALIQVSEPDAHGYCSLGVSVDIVRAAVESAELIIAEVNPRMPRTLGDSFIPVERIDCLVPVDAPLYVLATEPLDEVAKEIGRNVASLVPDGATLQVGIGNIPDAVLAALTGHRDLGVHTEMLSDGVMNLAEAGVITGRRKSMQPGKMVTSFVMGSEALYRWVHDNPAVEMRASDFTNDPFVIARNERMMAINTALGVDLTGQVVADTLLGQFFSGIGGQVDFIRGAARSHGGKPIIALRATAKQNSVSRIRACLEEGAGVVTSRGDVHYVVTEFGVADLWGKSVRERAQALIAIAHPDFRAELTAAACARRYVLPGQPVPRATRPWSEEREVALPTGHRVTLRPARCDDAERVEGFLHRLGSEEFRTQLLGEDATQAHQRILELVDPELERSLALLAVEPESCELVGLIRYEQDPATRLAEVLFSVRPDWQNRGLGTALFNRICEVARARGLAGIRAEVSSGNWTALTLLRLSGLRFESQLEGDVWVLEARFDQPAAR